MTLVRWVSLHDDVKARGMWDQGFLERLFSGDLWLVPRAAPYLHRRNFDASTEGSVVIIPGQHHTHDVEELNLQLVKLDWNLMIITSDECRLFAADDILTDRWLWLMTPKVGHDRLGAAARFIGEGYAADTLEILCQFTDEVRDKSLGMFLAGQSTHRLRDECFAAVRAVADAGDVSVISRATPGFLQGFDREEYLRLMSLAKLAPAPSGACTPDSFRCYEALEAGTLPIVDTPAYWKLLCDGDPPFPTLERWGDLTSLAPQLINRWPRDIIRASAWWTGEKRRLAWQMHDDVTELQLRCGDPVKVPLSPSELITVIMPTSPIPSHPDDAIIRATLDSIRRQPGLETCEIVVVCDGVRPELQHREAAYLEYVRRFTVRPGHNILPVLMNEWGHQANATREALRHVRTPLVLFVEHDTPIIGDVDWQALCWPLLLGELNSIKLHHETTILEPHKHMMLDHDVQIVEDVPVLRTSQWSQRPHLATTAFYERIIERYFTPESRGMIEDQLHGIVDEAYRRRGVPGWSEFRLAIYAPPGDNIKRSDHLDGRATDPKFEMRY